MSFTDASHDDEHDVIYGNVVSSNDVGRSLLFRLPKEIWANEIFLKTLDYRTLKRLCASDKTFQSQCDKQEFKELFDKKREEYKIYMTKTRHLKNFITVELDRSYKNRPVRLFVGNKSERSYDFWRDNDEHLYYHKSLLSKKPVIRDKEWCVRAIYDILENDPNGTFMKKKSGAYLLDYEEHRKGKTHKSSKSYLLIFIKSSIVRS